MKRVTIAVFAALALAVSGATAAHAELRDDGLGTEATSETQPESTETPVGETKDAADCAAYAGADDWCDPAFGDYDCPQIDNVHKPIVLHDPSDDPFRLDADGDGLGCENDVPSGGDDGDGDAGGSPEEPSEPPVEEEPVEEEPAEEEPDEPVSDCAHYAHSAAWCVDGVEDYDCDEIDDAHKPIELFDAEKDPFHLDRDVDAVGCEIDEDDGGSGGDGDGSGDDGSADGGATGGMGGSAGGSEQLPNTGAGLGSLWLAALTLLAGGALLTYRRARA